MSWGIMRKLLIHYLTAGYLSASKTLARLKACAGGGADQIELGIPWSDPVADGPVIQESSRLALAGGMTPPAAIALAGRFREAPLLLMTYYNPVLRFPVQDFFGRAAD